MTFHPTITALRASIEAANEQRKRLRDQIDKVSSIAPGEDTLTLARCQELAEGARVLRTLAGYVAEEDSVVESMAAMILQRHALPLKMRRPGGATRIVHSLTSFIGSVGEGFTIDIPHAPPKPARFLLVNLSHRVNPDFCGGYHGGANSDAPCGWVSGDSVDDCARLCREYLDANGFGGGNWSGGAIVRAGIDDDPNTMEVIARVAYNGTVWFPENSKRRRG